MVENEEDSYVSDVESVEEYNDLALIEEETKEIVSDIIADGYSKDDLYEIEHNFAAIDFSRLEKFVIEISSFFKDNVEISEAEELVEENGETIFCCSVIVEHNLVEKELMEQIVSIVSICNKFGILYDGWGTNISDEE